MAHGPSHSGGGGFHASSGGSFTHGPSHSSTHSGGYHPTGVYPMRRGPVVIYGGRGVYGSRVASTISTIIIITFFTSIILLALFLSFTDASKQLGYMKEDKIYYEYMIENVNTDFSIRKTYADILEIETDVYYEGVDYYYVQYKFYNEFTHSYCEGYTYSQYTYNEALELWQHGRIWVVYDSENPVNTINMDYNFKNAQYLSTLEERNSTTTAFAVICGIAIFIIFITVLVKKKNKANTESQTAYSTTTSDTTYNTYDSTSANTTFNSDTITNYCPYCGGALKKSQTRCPNCGAAMK